MGKEAAHQLARVQVAMWIGGKNIRCIRCGHKYDSVDDFVERDPLFIGRDHEGGMLLMDKTCLEAQIQQWQERGE